MKNRMLILVGALIMVFLGSHVRGQDTTAPEIFFKEKSFVADEVMEGTRLEHTYIVYNRGNEVLMIFSVKPG